MKKIKVSYAEIKDGCVSIPNNAKIIGVDRIGYSSPFLAYIIEEEQDSTEETEKSS